MTKKPLTRVSKRVPGAHGKRGLERGWQKRLAKGWRKAGEGLAKGWRRGTRLETRVVTPWVKNRGLHHVFVSRLF